MSDPFQDKENQATSEERTAGTSQVLRGSLSLVCALIAIGFIMWFMQYGSGSIRVPIVAIILGLIFGVIALIDGIIRLVWSFRMRGVIVGSVIGIALIGGAVWWFDVTAYNKALEGLPIDSFLEHEKITDYLRDHAWSPRVKDLDERMWKVVVDSDYEPARLRFYMETFTSTKLHEKDCDAIKQRTLAALRKNPDVDGCRWFFWAFAGPNDYVRNDPPEVAEVRDIMFKALKNKGNANELSPPLEVLEKLARLQSTAYTIEDATNPDLAKSATEHIVQRCQSAFALPWAKEDKNGNFRFKYQWSNAGYSSAGNDKEGTAQRVEVTSSIFVDPNSSSSDWTITKTFETPHDLSEAKFDWSDDVPSECSIYPTSDDGDKACTKAAVQQYLLKRPFRYWQGDDVKYVPPTN